MTKLLTVCVLACALAAHGGLVGILSSTTDDGLVTGGVTWQSGGEGLTVSWVISQNPDASWHYRYDFSRADGGLLSKQVAHFILSASEQISGEDFFNFSDGINDCELGNFGAGPSNPSLPSEQFFGLKISLRDDESAAEFDSARGPMWGDIYIKGGGNPKNYGYNSDFGIGASNPQGYTAIPMGPSGQPLFKILAPSALPEPSTIAILCSGLLFIRYN